MFRLPFRKYLEGSVLWVCMPVYWDHNLTLWFDFECFFSLPCVLLRLKIVKKSTFQNTGSHKEFLSDAMTCENMESSVVPIAWLALVALFVTSLL